MPGGSGPSGPVLKALKQPFSLMAFEGRSTVQVSGVAAYFWVDSATSVRGGNLGFRASRVGAAARGLRSACPTRAVATGNFPTSAALAGTPPNLVLNSPGQRVEREEVVCVCTSQREQ